MSCHFSTSIATEQSKKKSILPRFSFEEALSELPKGAQLHLDFFGEAVSFFGVNNQDNIQNVVASLDRFIIGIASKGKAFTGRFHLEN
jgi:hypothetical protein